MAAIQPNSTIVLYSGMPLDKSYQDTFYFTSRAAQTAFFQASEFRKHTFTAQSYQRVNEGIFEARINADLCYDCNYMAFQNSAYGDKWFYAFIDRVEWRNNENCYVYFSIDVMQTYFFDVVLEDCFVEREHTATDQIGDHILPEPVNPGEYVFTDYEQLMQDPAGGKNALKNYKLAVMVCDTGTGATVQTRVYDECVAGGYITVFNTDAAALAQLNSQLGNYVARPEAITALYMVPMLAIGAVTIPDGGAQLASTYHGQSVGVLKSALTGNETFDGYSPINNKLYTYPYNFFHVDDGNGNSAAFRYEFFEDLTPRFTVESCILPPVQVKLMPVQYKGMTGNAGLNSEFLTITGYPLCSWNYDSYKAWQAQNAIPTIIKAGIGAIGIAAAPFTGGASAGVAAAAIGAGVAGASMVGGAVSETYQASQRADVCKGNLASGNVNFGQEEMQYYSGRCHITAEHAKMIDDYFTMYGYRVNRVGKPSRRNRPEYTYTKTIGCRVQGSCPQDAIEQIEACYNRGITFWVNPANIGDYTVNNAPTT